MTLNDIIRDLLAAGSIRGAIRIAPTAELPDGATIIIQGTSPEFATHADAFGEPVMCWVYEKPNDPATPAQMTQRARVTAAAWAIKTLALTGLQRVLKAAEQLQLTAQQAAMRDVLRHPDLMGVPWDNFISIWDNGFAAWAPPQGIAWDAGLSWYDDGDAEWT